MASKKKQNDPADVKKVAEMMAPIRPGVEVGRPRRIVLGAMRSKMAFPSTGSTTTGSGGNFYSPEMSTDFLELPQTLDEQRNYFRFYYDNDPFVAQAIDLLTELPLSKVRLGLPHAQNQELADRSLRFFEKWVRKTKLLQRLVEVTHEYNLIGEAAVFCEDSSPEMPRDIWEEPVRVLHDDGTLEEAWQARPQGDADERAVAWLKKNYKGWTAIRVLPPEQMKVETFPFTDEKLVQFVPDSKSKAIAQKANEGDANAARIANSYPTDIYNAIISGQPITLNTDPDAGSFVFFLARKKSQYEEHGKSILQRCFLPGTPIWVNRGGIIQQVPVEDVKDGELLLTHKGRFRPCKTGSRLVDEEVISLDIEGIQDPLKLTAEHKVLRVNEDGSEEWVEAGLLRVGDYVCGAFVESENSVRSINLAEWWALHDSIDLCIHKKARETKCRCMAVNDVCVEGSTLSVEFTYPNDNRNRDRARFKLNQLLGWAYNLTEPVIKTQAEVAVESGLSTRDVRVYAPRLRNEGFLRADARSLGRGRGQSVTWHPSERDMLPLETVQISSPICEIPINEDFCYLLGAWLGDGCVWTDGESSLGTPAIGWSLHEDALRQRILVLLEKCFPGAVIQQGCLVSKRGHQGDLYIKDALLSRWFYGEFGYGYDGKHLPEWVFGLPCSHIQALLRGILDTDGWVSKKGTSLSISMCNRVLVDQIHLLATSVGWQTQVRRTVRQPTDWVATWENSEGRQTKTYKYGERECWVLGCYREQDILNWTNGCQKKPLPRKSRRGHLNTGVKICGKRFIRRVSSVSSFQYAGVVYAYAVKDDESHVTGGIVTHNCLRTLTFRDKVRQSLTSIASRHMTPYRLVYAEDMDEDQVEELREQVDLALQDPDYSIVTNFQVNWEEMGADQRLPDWSWVFDLTDRQLYAGLGMTESLLSGEASYSGDRIHLEVINTRFMLYREVIQEMVEDYFFAPMARRMGFVEEDEDGDLIPIIPKLSFTRLALRDNQETFDALLNLYQKGSLDIDVILELLNIDPAATKKKLERDLFGLNDASFNEVLRAAYTQAGQGLADNSDLLEKIAANLGLHYEKPKAEGGGRY